MNKFIKVRMFKKTIRKNVNGFFFKDDEIYKPRIFEICVKKRGAVNVDRDIGVKTTHLEKVWIMSNENCMVRVKSKIEFFIIISWH